MDTLIDNKNILLSKKEARLLNNPLEFYSNTSIRHNIDFCKKEKIITKSHNTLFKTYINMQSDYTPCFDFFKSVYKDEKVKTLESILFSNDTHPSGLKKQSVKKNEYSSNCLILVHGFKSRQKKIYLQIAQRFARRGIDSLLYTLPFHFERDHFNRDDDKMSLKDFRATLELFRQTVIELRMIISFLKKTGYKKVGVIGFSFGGYCASLLSCFEKNLDFAIPMASIGDFSSLKIFTRKNKKMYEDPLDSINSFFTFNYMRLICPINYFPVINTKNILFIQGFFDRRAPYHDVARLRNKWENPQICWYPCGHFAFFLFNNITVRLAEKFIKKLQ